MSSRRVRTPAMEIHLAEGGDGELRWDLTAPGSWVGLQGPVTLLPRHVREMAEDYDPQRVEEAAINVDHVRRGANLGVIGGLELDGEVLTCSPRLLDKRFLRAVRKGRYRYLSAEIDFEHPLTGRAYLTGVAALGAKKPAVKGLRPIAAPEGDQDMKIFSRGGHPPASQGEPEGSPDPPRRVQMAEPEGEAPVQPAASPPSREVEDGGEAEESRRAVEAELAESRRLRSELAEERAALVGELARHRVERDLAGLGTRITPALRSAGLEALAVELAARAGSTAGGTVELAEGEGRTREVSAYQALLAVLGALPDHDGLFQGELAAGDEGALLAEGGVTAAESRLLDSLGIDDARRKELDQRYREVH